LLKATGIPLPSKDRVRKDKGSLEAGKLADLAVLSQDILTIDPSELPKTESVLTMVGGKIVYDARVLPQQ
jgi:predicted amidohydrolase YtcJ